MNVIKLWRHIAPLLQAAVICTAVAIMLNGGLAAAAWAETATGASAGRAINLAGRQRMLTQRMAKAACLAEAGIARGDHTVEMLRAHDLFSETLKGLRSGSQVLGLAKPADADVARQLDLVAAQWQAYGTSVRGYGDQPSRAALQRIAVASLPILNDMDFAVALIERAFDDPRTDRDLANAINVSGRQRMLSQKMVKEYCLIAIGHQPRVNLALLRGSMALFESSQAGLRVGFRTLAISDAQASALEKQFSTVEVMWADFRAPLDWLIETGDADTEGLQGLAERDDDFLAALNRIVALLEGR